MKLSNNTIKKLIFGAYQFKENGGYLEAYRFSDEQLEAHPVGNPYHYRLLGAAGITLEFKTDADKFGFDYIVKNIAFWDSVDVFVDGIMHHSVAIDTIAARETKFGKGHFEFALPEGKNKKVCVYFPTDCTLFIKKLEIFGSYSAVKKDKAKRVLWLGDSITQGYGSQLASYGYVSVAKRILGWNILNQGIGGYGFFSDILHPLEGKFDRIMVAFGTNDRLKPEFHDNIDAFLEKLSKLFCDIPVTVISPVWRLDMEGINEARDYLVKACEKYPLFDVIDGTTLMPNAKPYLYDHVHPNGIGCEYYGTKLASLIK